MSLTDKLNKLIGRFGNIDIVLAVPPGKEREREKELEEKQKDLDEEKRRHPYEPQQKTQEREKALADRQQELDERKEKLKSDGALIMQYCAMRKHVRASYPEGLDLPGDQEAGYLLAAEHAKGVPPKVVGGFRLNEIPAAGGKIPADKIEKVRLENLLPGIKRANYAVLNVDGAYLDPELLKDSSFRGKLKLKAVFNLLLEGMVKNATTRKYDAVSFAPAEKFGEHVSDFYTEHSYLKEKNIPIVDYKTATYKDSDGKESTKRVFAIILNQDLKKFVPPEPAASVLPYR